jgi:hypothetical protein
VAVLELLLLPRLARRLVVPPLLLLEPAVDPRRAADQAGRALRLGVRVRVDEDVVAVARDRKAAVRVADAAEPLEQGVGVVRVDVDPEVVGYAGILPEIPTCSRCFVIPPRKKG